MAHQIRNVFYKKKDCKHCLSKKIVLIRIIELSLEFFKCL